MMKASKCLQMINHSALHFFTREINSDSTISEHIYEFKMSEFHMIHFQQIITKDLKIYLEEEQFCSYLDVCLYKLSKFH